LAIAQYAVYIFLDIFTHISFTLQRITNTVVEKSLNL